jgi:hypothetical protein
MYISAMLEIEPSSRPTASTLLHNFSRYCAPEQASITENPEQIGKLHGNSKIPADIAVREGTIID